MFHSFNWSCLIKGSSSIFSKNNLRDLWVQVKGRKYPAEYIGNNKHRVVFPEIRSSGEYSADVFDGDNFVAQVEFEVQSGSARDNDADWF